MREKVDLKRKYKLLIRAGKQDDADRVLEKIWKLCGSNKTIPRLRTVPEVEAKKYTKEDLEKLSFSELRVIGYKTGTKGRGSAELIREILALQ